MPNVTWLHISDLHWRESEAYDVNVVAQALLRDLAERSKIAPCLGHIDFVFVTGDIAFASKPEEYALAKRFLEDLRRTVRIRKNRLFLVPGNHDVDRSIISDMASDIVRKCTERSAVNDLLENDVQRAIVMERLHCYQEFANSYFGKDLVFDNVRYFYVKMRKIAGNRRAAILGLNSAWASASDADRLNLFLGERQVRDALDQAKHADIRIVLMHHPFDWQQDFDRDTCEPLLLDNCDFVLHGHLHRTGLSHLQAPGSEATIVAAGACYDTRNHPNAYNLVHLDFDSGKGTVYLRMYGDQRGGFWTKDVLTYQSALGEYTFDLPGIGTDKAARPAQRRTGAGQEGVGLDKWWEKRSYKGNPFAWSNAAEVTGDRVSELFHSWHVDPNTKADLEGLGPTPTLDKAKSPDTSRLVLIYAPGGGGKTFYRRWVAQQINEEKRLVLEIRNIGQHEQFVKKNVTVQRLTACIYDRVCEQFAIPMDLSPHEHAVHILRKCDDSLERLLSASPGSERVYILVDDVGQLFDARPSRKNRNARALTALAELCRMVAERGGGEPLALRMFVPQQLMASLQNRLQELIDSRRIAECAITWTAAHCQAVIERRLDSRWNGGPNTGTNHLSRLFTQDARDEFHEWLQDQEDISPGRVVEILDRLAFCAYSRGVAADERISVELWKKFSRSSKCTDICTPDTPYPGV